MPPSSAESGAIFLVRHGQTDWNVEGRCQGWTDRPLDATGRKQAEDVAEHFREHPIVKILSSSLTRARQTADAINRHHDLPITVVDDLREIHHGRLEGTHFHRLEEEWPEQHHHWVHSPGSLWMPEGESVVDVQTRAARVFEEIAVEHLEHQRNGGPYGHVVVVAHNLTISSILCHLVDCHLDRLKDWRLDNCGYHEIRHDGDGDGAWKLARSHRAAPMDA